MFRNIPSPKAGKSNSPKFSSKIVRTDNLQNDSCCKFKNIAVILLGVCVSFVIVSVALILFNKKTVVRKDDTIEMQIDELAQKAKPSNFEFLGEQVPISGDEVSLPIVDQEDLAEQYQNELKEIIADLEQKIQLSSEQESLDIQTIIEIKEDVMEKIVPRDYQDLHLDLVLALDLMIGGDVSQAEEIFNTIKSKMGGSDTNGSDTNDTN
jgi:hypothetical protein